MPRSPLLLSLLLLALLPAAASAAQTVVEDPAAQTATALGGTLVWVSGDGPGQTLMQRSPDGAIAPVAGAGEAAWYRNVDLGRDAGGDLVLTYQRCATAARCVAYRDDLAGSREKLEGLGLRRCAVTAPAVWRKRVAYGLECWKRVDGDRVTDRKRSGLYVRYGSREARRISPPRAARRAGATSVQSVDIRGRRVAAIMADIYGFAVVADAEGSNKRAWRVATSEGESDARATGLALGTTSTAWTLVQSTVSGDPNRSLVHRLRGSCQQWQELTGTPTEYPALDLAADGSSLYLVVPGTGIVRHEFAPKFPC